MTTHKPLSNGIPIQDGYQNVVSQLGTPRDKSSHGTYVHINRDPNQLLAAYRSAWLPRKIVDIPALDATRRWRSWSADKADITSLELIEKRLQVQRKMRDALILARLYGGAAIYISTNGNVNPEDPLDVNREGCAGIRQLTVVPRHLLVADNRDRELESELFGTPTHYRIVGAANEVRIHHTRLIRLVGAPLPFADPFGLDEGWGDSVLDAIFDAIMQADATAANIAALVHEAKVDVIHIPRLMELIATPKGEAAVLQYVRSAMTTKSSVGALILDGGDTSKPEGHSGGTRYETKHQSFSGLDSVWDRFLQSVSGAADIPTTRLLGQSPAGLNSTGESDLRNYYDRIQSHQTLDLEPALTILDQLMSLEATGKPLDDIHFEWRSLWQTTDEERAALGKSAADTIATLRGTELWPDEVLSKAGANAMIESGSMPGLEAALDEWAEEEEPQDADPDLAAPATGPFSRLPALRVVGDAAPRPLYVYRKVLNGAAILRWARAQGFQTTIEAAGLHVTLAYSKAPVDWMKTGESWSPEIRVGEGGPRMVDQFGDARVLLFTANELRWRHEEIKEAGAVWDHDEYQPHITFSHDPNSPDLSGVEPYSGPIILGPEIYETIDENWADKIKESTDEDN